MPMHLQPCISAGWLEGLLGSANLPFIDALLLHHCPSLSEGGHLRRNVVSFGETERGGLLLVVLGEIDRPMCRWVMPVGMRSLWFRHITRHPLLFTSHFTAVLILNLSVDHRCSITWVGVWHLYYGCHTPTPLRGIENYYF